MRNHLLPLVGRGKNEELLLSLFDEDERSLSLDKEEFFIKLCALFLLSLHFCCVVVEGKRLRPSPVAGHASIMTHNSTPVTEHCWSRFIAHGFVLVM